MFIDTLYVYHCTQGDVTVDDSDSELCTGQSFGVHDEGYISMMQVETEERKLWNSEDGKKDLKVLLCICFVYGIQSPRKVMTM